MITNSSKLMLANKEIEFLQDQLKVANNDILELEEDITFVERELKAEKDMVAELNTKLRLSQENFNSLDALYKELKYDKDHPWWKVW